MTTRLVLLALAAGLLAASGCGRKGAPERPEPARVAEPVGFEREQYDDPLLEPLPEPVTPSPRIEERVDEDIPG